MVSDYKRKMQAIDKKQMLKVIKSGLKCGGRRIVNKIISFKHQFIYLISRML